jgi:hypothetical protein
MSKTPEYTLSVETPADAVVIHQHEVDALRSVAARIADDYPPLAAELRTVADSMESLVVATRVIEYVELATRIRTVKVIGGNEATALTVLANRYREAPPAFGIGWDVVDVDPDMLRNDGIEVLR